MRKTVLIAVATVAIMALCAAGCASMRDPDATNMPWAETPTWVTTPALGGAIMNP